MVKTGGEPTLADLLKKKGIGPEGSKSLNKAELQTVNHWLKDPMTSDTTKATLVTALLMLEPTIDEQGWIDALTLKPEEYLPSKLIQLLPQSITQDRFAQIIKAVISKMDLTEDVCNEAMDLLLDNQTPGYLKGPFLEAERLKRETFTENKSFLQHLWNNCNRKQSDLPIIIDIGDSYDGNNRTLQLSVFVAATLASGGFPCYVHGVEKVAPKEGITAHQVLKLAGKNPLRSIDAAITDLENPHIGWAYVDQQIYFPKLYDLRKMRKEMVKRPFLATFEKVLQPIQSKQGNHLVTGYTHLHYRSEMVKQLANQRQCIKAIVLRGAEGSTGMSLNRDTICVYYNGDTIQETILNPGMYDIRPTHSSINKMLQAEDSVNEGLNALQGMDNAAKESILYSCSVIATQFGFLNQSVACSYFKERLENGTAFDFFKRGCL